MGRGKRGISTANPAYVHSGSYGAELGPAPGELGYLCSDLADRRWLELLGILFGLDNPSGGTPNEFQVRWNGTVLYDGVNLPAFGWTDLQFVVTATGSSDILQLGFRQDPSYLGLDDISVIPTNLPPSPVTVDHFAWSTIPSAESENAPFGVTVTAQDVSGAAYQFCGCGHSQRMVRGRWTTNRMMEGMSPTAPSSGTFTWGYPFTPTNNLTVTHVSSYFGTKCLVGGSGALLASPKRQQFERGLE